mmetsp:Transcript_148132/g.474194  ORF Transcript_148132/g.474194 Transcript_148132/m.474194 type:complete len:328 (+) Transcript_148132:504-1487(+)
MGSRVAMNITDHRERLREEFVKSRERTFLLEKMWKVMEDPQSSSFASAWERCMCFLIGVSIVTALMMTANKPFWNDISACMFEVAVEIVFAVEIFTRLVACPNRMRFFRNPYNIVDILSALPIGLRVIENFRVITGREACDIWCSMLRSLVPVLRLLKFLRHFQQFHLLLKAFAVALEALPIMIFIYVLIMMGFTSAIYIVEPADNVESFMKALWLAIVSMTTVGYGDISPSTDAGRIVVSVFVFASSMYMAIPLGIIGNAFNDVWKDRDHILLMQKTRTLLIQAVASSHAMLVLTSRSFCRRCSLSTTTRSMARISRISWMTTARK